MPQKTKLAEINEGIDKALQRPDEKGDAPNPTFTFERWNLAHGVTVTRFKDKQQLVRTVYKLKVERGPDRDVTEEFVRILFRLAGRHEKRAK